jgi:hypothetical protein
MSASITDDFDPSTVRSFHCSGANSRGDISKIVDVPAYSMRIGDWALVFALRSPLRNSREKPMSRLRTSPFRCNTTPPLTILPVENHPIALKGEKDKKKKQNGPAIRLLRPRRRLPQTRHRLFLRELLRRLGYRGRSRAICGSLHERRKTYHGV